MWCVWKCRVQGAGGGETGVQEWEPELHAVPGLWGTHSPGTAPHFTEYLPNPSPPAFGVK